MTIREAIDRADTQKPNQFTEEEKISWLSQLDANIHRDILMAHEPVPETDFIPYAANDIGNELIAPFPYDELYVAYLKMKFDEMNEETARYNNSQAFYTAHYENYARFINKTQRPVNNHRLHTW